MWKRGGAVVILLSTAMVLGCTGSVDDHEDDGQEEAGQGGQAGESEDHEQPAVQAVTGLPDEDVVVVAADTAAERAVSTSELLFSAAPVVLLADEDDIASQAAAASLAVGFGVPLLLTPGADPDTEGTAGRVESEVGRLEPEVVLAIGDVAAGHGEQWRGSATVMRATSGSAQMSELAELGGVALGDPVDVTDGELVATVAGMAADAPASLTLNGVEQEPEAGEQVDGNVGDSPFPAVIPAAPLDTLTVFTEAGVENAAAVATARASGARVLVAEDTDPRADTELIAALSERPADQTLALGGEFGPAETLRSRLAVAATGVELPGGGQTLFPGRRFIALYGTPRSSAMGALGEQPLEETVERAQEIAARYEETVEEPIVPAMEIITTIAHTEPGPEGDYSSRTPVPELRPWIDAAADAGMYVVLDLQPGHTDFLSQAQEYEELLLEPHVGLALDPEWRLADGQRHLQQIGRVDAEEINEVADWLAELTAEHQLPQKLLVLHQFTVSMITDRADVETGHDELAVLIHADGFGTPELKFETWDRLRAGSPDGIWWGWKNFIDEDQPTFTPAETMDVEPAPWFVSYQ